MRGLLSTVALSSRTLLCGSCLRFPGPPEWAPLRAGTALCAFRGPRLCAAGGSTFTSPGQRSGDDQPPHGEWMSSYCPETAVAGLSQADELRRSSRCTVSVAAFSNKNPPNQLPSGVITAEGWLGGMNKAHATRNMLNTLLNRCTEWGCWHTAEWSGFVCRQCGRSHTSTLIFWTTTNAKIR